jgi:hypothetical protein
MKILRTILALALTTLPAVAAAATLFSDNFNAETPGLNRTPSRWTVSGGTVDIIGSGPNGTLFDAFPGNGYYIDLDGSTNNAGRMSSAGALSLSPGIAYNLSFDLAGTGGVNTVIYGIDFNSDATLDIFSSATLPGGVAFTQFNLPFVALVSTSNARIVFDHLGGDNNGLLLDDVVLTGVAVIPEPESYALLLAGLGLLGFAAPRKKRRASQSRARR